jgi:hypothetical protein
MELMFSTAGWRFFEAVKRSVEAFRWSDFVIELNSKSGRKNGSELTESFPLFWELEPLLFNPRTTASRPDLGRIVVENNEDFIRQLVTPIWCGPDEIRALGFAHGIAKVPAVL